MIGTMFLLNCVGLILIIRFTQAIYNRSGSLLILGGIGIIYFWTIAGSWFFLFDEASGRAGEAWGLHYYYIFQKMFPVRADSFYMKGLLLYHLFILSIQAALYFLAPSKRPLPNPARLEVNHGVFLLSALIAVSLSFVIIYPDIHYALNNKLSVYTTTRNSQSRFYTLHQFLNFVAVFSSLFGFTIYQMRFPKLLLTEKPPAKFYGIAYTLVICLVLTFMLILGNKHELFIAGVCCILFYLVYNNKLDVLRFARIFILILIPLILTDTLRRYSFGPLSFFFERPKNTEIVNSVFTSMFFSNEMFFAHFSIYGVLKQHLDPTWGTSFVSLISSFIPRAIWPNRPAEIYSYYASGLALTPGQGYTIHHATAWYLNFGSAGVVLGGITLGTCWAFCMRMVYHMSQYRHNLLKTIAILLPVSFVAFLPLLLRNGPEAYKAVIIEGALFPAVLLYIANTFAFKRNE